MEYSKTNPIKILIADDHQMFIDGIKAILKDVKYISIAGEALNGAQAIELINANSFDLVIADIQMPVMDGLELTKYIKQNKPNIKVLIVTSHPDRGFIEEMLEVQAEGYILKNTSKQELIRAISKLVDHATYYSSEVISILTENIKKKEKVQEKIDILSSREKEIVCLICQEYSNTEIAEKLFISYLTVETHRKNIYKKTGIKTIVGLIRYAIENGLS